MTNATTTHMFGNTEIPVVRGLEGNYDLRQLETMSRRIKQHIRMWIKTMEEAQQNIMWNLDHGDMTGALINADNLLNPVEYAQRLANYMHGLHQVQQRIAEVKASA